MSKEQLQITDNVLYNKIISNIESINHPSILNGTHINFKFYLFWTAQLK
jgi:hypothetical protein